MEVYELILKRRSIRKFRQKTIEFDLLKKIVNSARVAPSAANLQFLEYIIIDDHKLVESIFPLTRWAAYIYPRGTPKEGERPPVYIAVLINLNKSKNPDLRDVGAAVENMILTALSFGIGSCWLGAIDKGEISKLLKLPPHIKLDSLLALGYPLEEPIMVEDDENVKYWRDERGKHYVPKRSLRAILFHNEYGNRC